MGTARPTGSLDLCNIDNSKSEEALERSLLVGVVKAIFTGSWNQRWILKNKEGRPPGGGGEAGSNKGRGLVVEM